MPRRLIVIAVMAGLVWTQILITAAADKKLPQPDHVVVVIFENHSFDQIFDPWRAPFIYDLATNGALFINAFAIAHPSQPNYFALFSGSTQDVRDNDYDYNFNAPNLASALSAAHKSFIGYIETGSPREHNPWESFNNARNVERNFTELPNDFTQLPTVAFIIPNLRHDMHDGSVRDGDTWLKDHLGPYVEWAQAHNSLLVVAFDEDNDRSRNHILTVILGAHVQPNFYAERITHYNVFSTLLALYALPPFAGAVTSPPIYSIWE
jgi:acid phosphatase